VAKLRFVALRAAKDEIDSQRWLRKSKSLKLKK
jgi:hypothetical protein